MENLGLVGKAKEHYEVAVREGLAQTELDSLKKHFLLRMKGLINRKHVRSSTYDQLEFKIKEVGKQTQVACMHVATDLVTEMHTGTIPRNLIQKSRS
jgi:hypothetical protein